MPEELAAVLGWVIPAVVVFGVAAIAIAALIWGLRRAARGPRALAAAEARRDTAGAKLVALDDAVAELDLEVGLSGALYGGDAPPSLRRARMSAQHTRDALFEEYRALLSGADGSEPLPHEVSRASDRISATADKAIALTAAARGEHVAWMRTHVSVADQIAAAQRRLDDLRAAMGDPTALVADLSARFAEEEWTDAAHSADTAIAETERAQRVLATAAVQADDPTASALSTLAEGERALRTAQEAARALEESHRLVTQAAQAVPDELDAARSAMRQAMVTREGLEPVDSDRLGTAIAEAERSLAALRPQAPIRPTWTVDQVAHLRDRLDLALGDARTAQQRLRGARSALPGTLAAARGAVARAEASAAHTHPSADARVRLVAAERELAAARQASDPVEALDAARRAMRHAEDAQALADYDTLRGGRKS
ncbi:MAG: hypothetical protein ACK5IN_00555 [Microbacterium sp.]|uniref:hypothetical protein n=1 Tax=Microbacterium sp. TaxID=51671 RepID=UPI003A8AA9F5